MKKENVKILYYKFKCPYINNEIAKVEAHFVNYGKENQIKITYSCHNTEDCSLTDKTMPARITLMDNCHYVLNEKKLKPLENSKLLSLP